nr:unnamed protein product [Callosobruchus chinensis]
MFYCTLRDLVLYLHKDENGFRRNQIGGDNLTTPFGYTTRSLLRPPTTPRSSTCSDCRLPIKRSTFFKLVILKNCNRG